MLKQAALQLFVQNGYEGARLADIAKAVNIKTPSIYFHFASKEELFTQLFEDIRDQKLAGIMALKERIRGMATARERLWCLYDAFSHRRYEDNPEAVFWKRCALFPPSFLEEKIHADLIAYQHRYVDELLRPTFAAGIGEGELRAMEIDKGVVVFLSMIQGMFSEYRYSEPAAYEQKIAILWDFFWDSVRGDARETAEEQ